MPPPPPPAPAVVEPEIRIPVDRIITDTSGRSVRATIVGRTMDQIYIIRSPDGMRSSVPFAKLSEPDQAYVVSLPIVPPPREFFKQSVEAKKEEEKSLTASDAFVANREKEIERLTEENLTLGEEISATDNKMSQRSRLSEIRKNEKEIARMRADIDRVRSGSP